MINIVSSSRYKINRKSLKKETGAILNELGVTANITVNIVFIGRNKMKTLAASYKKERIALPVLSFSYKDEKVGEVFICYPQAVLLAAERNRKVERTIIELIKHGLGNLLI